MNENLFNEFLSSEDTLRVYDGGRLIFSSAKDGLLPLVEYIERPTPHPGAVIFDKVMGNAAALLSVRAGAGEVFSPLGSQFAVGTLERYGIKHHLTQVIPCIRKPDGSDMCPMEKLSLDKEPEDFYRQVKDITGKPPAEG